MTTTLPRPDSQGTVPDSRGTSVITRALPPRRRRGLLTPGNILVAVILLVVLLWTLVPGLFTSADPLVGEPADRLQGPSLSHLFGTDHLGRDVWTRVIHGTRESVVTAASAVLVAIVAGTLIGTVSGYIGGVVDTLLARLTDVLQSIPSLLLSIAVVAGLGFGPGKVAVAVGIASVPTFVRVSRTEVLRWRSSDFVEAARLSGIGTGRILLRHILPHSLSPLVGLAVLEFGTALLAVSSLSFLGLGSPPPAPEWGLLVSDGRSYLASAWWLATLPGLVIAVTVIAVNQLSRTLTATRRTS
ncbi:ABC transporter permease [Corynebacterium glyciniphilum]|jgi:peptide/nickel transport system permease protein|uniref:ABC-type transporter, permease subunit n=1 Tax=Corynebacterium glyciniphilum AJ 3170 TaxID=1404245 RepID=X5EFI3_9CORY|nr:ABC transporter permease [Corynebacterium glyciniphilum]AHW65346.1 ABC-type transporter, permease subunit [Corynebacterium glyciniphilum AJ 3170]